MPLLVLYVNRDASFISAQFLVVNIDSLFDVSSSEFTIF